ncbi:hypothetical protein RCH33_813 [Flavobacterium daejeonense]|nr:hypothetical protein RCH33_813 [Flavobacterium daejeonense]
MSRLFHGDVKIASANFRKLSCFSENKKAIKNCFQSFYSLF